MVFIAPCKAASIVLRTGIQRHGRMVHAPAYLTALSRYSAPFYHISLDCLLSWLGLLLRYPTMLED